MELRDIIETITARMEKHMDDITDCCGDHALYQGLDMAIKEDQYILDLLVEAE